MQDFQSFVAFLFQESFGAVLSTKNRKNKVKSFYLRLPTFCGIFVSRMLWCSLVNKQPQEYRKIVLSNFCLSIYCRSFVALLFQVSFGAVLSTKNRRDIEKLFYLSFASPFTANFLWHCCFKKALVQSYQQKTARTK